MSAPKSLEIEVKFFLDHLSPIRQQLLEAGAEIDRPRVYERNVRFDTAENELLKRRELLRLREDTDVILTFKGVSELDLSSEAKIREEIEVRVDDFDRMTTILGRLGYQPLQIYEKYRETFHLNGVEVVLDEMPYGNFVELEGDEAGIKRAADLLGLNWQDRILSNYLAMMGILVRRYDLPFQDVTFDNFHDVNVSIKDILPITDEE